MSIKEIALDLTIFTITSVNDAISFKPQMCFEVPKEDYQQLKEDYINFTGTSIRKNRSKLFFLPTNVSDELQKLNASVPESAKKVPNDGMVYYKNRLITELDYENVKRVELACAFIAYTALNSFVHFETEVKINENGGESGSSSVDVAGHSSRGEEEEENEEVTSSESVTRALKKGNILGFRELGHLVGITPWHFHRVFKVITGLTIREYGQLCVEFIKKNKELISACRARVMRFRLNEHYSCLDDTHFLKDGGLQYPATENIILLPDYFVDPNKSKEFKKRKSNTAKPVQEEVNYGINQRSQIRKRRSSVVYSRIQRASQSMIPSNSLNDCLVSPTTGKRSTSLPRQDVPSSSNYNDVIENDFGNEIENETFNNYHYSNIASGNGGHAGNHNNNNNSHNSNLDNDTDESSSASSDWERPLRNVFPPLSTPTSRKNSVISIGGAGVSSFANNNKVSKKGGNLLEAQRRNRADGLGLTMDSLKDAELDQRLGMPLSSSGTEVRSSSGGNNPPSSISFNSNMFQNDDAENVDFTSLDYNANSTNDSSSSGNMFQRQFQLDPKFTGQNETNRFGSAAATTAASAATINAGSTAEDKNNNGSMAPMTDISLFNNSLLDHTAATPTTNLLLDTDPASVTTSAQEELDVDTLLNNSSSLLDDLAPFNFRHHHYPNLQPQRKGGTVPGGELFGMPEENELFDSLNGDLLAGDALLSFEH